MQGKITMKRSCIYRLEQHTYHNVGFYIDLIRNIMDYVARPAILRLHTHWSVRLNYAVSRDSYQILDSCMYVQNIYRM